MKRKIHVILLTAGILTAGILVAVLLQTFGWTLPCPVRLLTGLNCPGCGNTRATLALLRLDFKAVFEYNMLYFPEIFYILWIYGNICRNYIRDGRFAYGNRWVKWDLAFLVILVLWMVIRNVTPLY